MAVRAVEDLAARLGVPANAVAVVAMRRVEWSDACLGVHFPDQACAQVITSGYWLKLRAQGKDYIYHTDTRDRVIAVGFARGASVSEPLDLPLVPAPAPPQARLVTSGGQQVAGIGSYCWSDAGAGVCSDKGGLPIPRVAALARADESLVVHLAFQPTEVSLSAWRLADGQLGDEISPDGLSLWQPQGRELLARDLAPSPKLEVAPDLPPGRYVVMVSAVGAKGDVAYGFLLEIAAA